MTAQENYIWFHVQKWYDLPENEKPRIMSLVRRYEESITGRERTTGKILGRKYAQRIVECTVRHLGVDEHEMKRKGREYRNAYARQLICYLLRISCGMTHREILTYLQPAYGLPAITHHSTIVHSVHNINDMIEVDDGNVRNDIAKIIDMVQTAP